MRAARGQTKLHPVDATPERLYERDCASTSCDPFAAVRPEVDAVALDNA